MKARYYLWQLYQIEQDMAGARGEAGTKKGELNAAARELHAKEAAVEEHKKAAAGLAKERLALERKHKKRRADLEKKARAALPPSPAETHSNARTHCQKLCCLGPWCMQEPLQDLGRDTCAFIAVVWSSRGLLLRGFWWVSLGLK